jgi:hypothetical protein
MPDYFGVEANALSRPPGEYGRKTKTQRNWRGPAQAVEHALQLADNPKTLPGLDMYEVVNRKGNDRYPVRSLHRCCMAVVSSYREAYP